jgi:hypothetical protein
MWHDAILFRACCKESGLDERCVTIRASCGMPTVWNKGLFWGGSVESARLPSSVPLPPNRGVTSLWPTGKRILTRCGCTRRGGQ